MSSSDDTTSDDEREAEKCGCDRANTTVVLNGRGQESKEFLCAACASPARPDKKLFTCRGCKIAKYCDVECQRTHWRSHKEECIQLRDLAARNVKMPGQDNTMVAVQGKRCMGMRIMDDPIKAWGVVCVKDIPKGVNVVITPRLFKEEPTPGVDHLVVNWYNCNEKSMNSNLPPMYVDHAFLEDIGRDFQDVPSLEALAASDVHLFSISLGIYLGVIQLHGPHQTPIPVRSLEPGANH